MTSSPINMQRPSVDGYELYELGLVGSPLPTTSGDAEVAGRQQIPMLVFPEPKKLAPLEGAVVCDNAPLPVRRVFEKEWDALIFNTISVIFIFAITLVICWIASLNKQEIITTTIIVVGISLVLIVPRSGVKVNALRGKVYVDYLLGRPNELIVYMAGFHFTTWCSGKQAEELDFENGEDAGGEKDKDGKVCRVNFKFPAQNNLWMEANIGIFFRRDSEEEPLGRSLRYPMLELKRRTRAVVAQRLSDLGGENSWQTLLRYKGDAEAWISLLFGTAEQKSLFEQETGLRVLPLAVEYFDLTEDSKKTIGGKAKIEVINDGITKLMQHDGMTAEDAGVIARVAEGTADEQINTHRGIPQGAKFVAIGEAGMAAATRR